MIDTKYYVKHIFENERAEFSSISLECTKVKLPQIRKKYKRKSDKEKYVEVKRQKGQRMKNEIGIKKIK